MKKINAKKFLLFIISMLVVCLVKSIFIDSIPEQKYCDFVHDVLIYWGDNYLNNIVWLLPIILSVYIISGRFYLKLREFETRYWNRKRYVKAMLKNIFISSMFLNFMISLAQIIVFTIYFNKQINIDLNILSVLFRYVLENTFLNILIILCSMYINNYMFIVVVALIIIILSLTMTINLNVFAPNMYIPFVNIYYSESINIITILLIPLILYFIGIKYEKCDIIGGGEL